MHVHRGPGRSRCLPRVPSLSLTALLLLAACQAPGPGGDCLDEAAACQVASACPSLTYSCDGADPSLELRTILAGDPVPGGLDALGARGDVLIGNGKIVAVIAGLGNQNYLDPNGGSILDLGNRGRNDDSINQILQVVGILPRDAAHYTSLKLIDESPTRVAVQVAGTLDSVPGAVVYTLYEVRPCEPGVRVSTEIVNGTPDQQLYALSDGFYWSNREALPFTPTQGTGFNHPDFTLLTINDAYQDSPSMAASGHGPPQASYAVVGCNQDPLQGFHSETVSAIGLPRTVVAPRDYQVYQRFLAVAPAVDVAGASDIVQGVRGQLHGEPSRTLTGLVAGLPIGGEREASVLISAGTLSTPAAQLVPLTQVVPAPDGTFAVQVPQYENYVIEVDSFGRAVARDEALEVTSDRDVGTFTVPVPAQILAGVIDDAGNYIDAEIFVIPADAATQKATTGTLFGQFETCAPWLGAPPGDSPACNRFLVNHEGPVGPVEVPAGHYYFYAFHGPFYTLARQELTLTAGMQATVNLTLSDLSTYLKPPGTLSADLHVHGAASFDSSIPERDRVRSFAATNVDVIVATDHDVAHDYGPLVRAMLPGQPIITIIGVETTGHIPFLYAPRDSFPLVIGHYNFWPIAYQPALPRAGAPFDEYLEPGQLMDRIDPLFTDVSIAQLNHPWADPQFGRDLGFPRAINVDALRDLPAADDGTGNGLYVRVPAGATHSNDDHQTQEVMNGGLNVQLMAYRSLWFYQLNQGLLKTGTANSDSHGLTDDTVGSPRNLVFAGLEFSDFAVGPFNQALRAGHNIGTNGPIILASIDGADGRLVSCGLSPFQIAPGANLHLQVVAAPWVPVAEIRIIVNGMIVKTIGSSSLMHPTDPLGSAGLVRYDQDVPLAGLLPGSGDAWLVVEAGDPLPLAADLGGGPNNQPDGIPDTGDNNGDGVVNQADVAPGSSVGPLNGPAPPSSPSDPRYHFAQVVQGSYPMSFTNPFVLDLNRNGVFDPPRTKGVLGIENSPQVGP